VSAALRLHVLPTFGARPMASVRRSEIQAWLAGLRSTMGQPGSVKVVYSVLRGLMRAAVIDRVIVVSPCDGVSAPTVASKTLAIPSAADVAAVAEALPERLAAVPYVAAGLGLRPGEVFGLAWSDVDFLGRRVSVARQLDEQQALVPLKTTSSLRTVPLPDVVSLVLAEHVKRTGRRDGLVFVGATGAPIKRNTFGKTWRTAVPACRAGAGPAPARFAARLRVGIDRGRVVGEDDSESDGARLGDGDARRLRPHFSGLRRPNEGGNRRLSRRSCGLCADCRSICPGQRGRW
jgi:integrase